MTIAIIILLTVGIVGLIIKSLLQSTNKDDKNTSVDIISTKFKRQYYLFNSESFIFSDCIELIPEDNFDSKYTHVLPIDASMNYDMLAIPDNILSKFDNGIDVPLYALYDINNNYTIVIGEGVNRLEKEFPSTTTKGDYEIGVRNLIIQYLENYV